MQILRQALEEFELTRDVNVDTCASPPEAETITAEAPTQNEEPFFNPQPTSDTLNVTVETQSKRCQATIPVPQRTRRIQVNCPPVVTVSIGTQCSSLTDNVPLRVAAGLVPLPQQPDPLPLASDDEEDDQPGHQDPNYDPMEDSDESESSEGEEDVVTTYPLRRNAEPEDERQFLVSETCLAQLLHRCDSCGGDCDSYVQFTRGTMVGTVLACPNEHSKQWEIKASGAITVCHG